MKISGFTFVRNGVMYDYPFIESIRSLLPLCDEIVIAVGDSLDETKGRLLNLNDPKILMIETVWDQESRFGGHVLAEQTNLALEKITGDWAIYLQADEVLHEKDFQLIRESMVKADQKPDLDGLLFKYHHFYGSYEYVGASRKWYRREIRAFKAGRKVQSWGDAQGFRIGTKKLRVALINAFVYHYGWVKSPTHQQDKQREFNKYWHPDETVREMVGNSISYDYSRGGKLEVFHGEHPKVMQERIANMRWNFLYDPTKIHQSLPERISETVESLTGYRIGEYKNYVLTSF